MTGAVTNGEGGILAGHGVLSDPLETLIIQIIIIITLTRLLGWVLAKLKQPRVISEVIGGIILGPTCLGRISAFQNTIFPASSLPYLQLFGNFGLVLFLFIVGLELDLTLLKGRGAKPLAISVVGILLPFGFGAALSVYIYQWMTDNPDGSLAKLPSFGSFLLFMGVAMSITAFPVLARILTELRLLRTPVGITAISAAAVDDVVAWCFLAIVISIISATSPLNALWVMLMCIGYGLFLFFIVGPVMLRLVTRYTVEGAASPQMLVLAFIICLFSAWCTEWMGIHPIFGAFLAGIVMPRKNGFAVHIIEKIEDLVTGLFLPLYFVYSGLKTNIGLLNTGQAWLVVFLVILTACGGKIIGCTAIAKLLKMTWRESFAVGILMNTKGLVELIVLNIGLSNGIISSTLFSIMVVMALVTTFMTTPIISYVYPSEFWGVDIEKDLSVTGLELKVSPSIQTLIAAHVRSLNMLLTVPSLRSLGSVVNMSHLLVGKSDFIPNQPDSVHAVRLLELSERLSDTAKASHLDKVALTDPVTSLFSMFGLVHGISVKPHFLISSIDNMAADVSELIHEHALNMLLIPYDPSPESALYSELDFSSFKKVTSKLIKRVPCTTCIFVDRGLPVLSMASELLVNLIYLGGPDDEEALIFASRMARFLSVKIRILAVQLKDNSSSSALAVSSPVPSDVFRSLTELENVSVENVGVELKEMLQTSHLSEVLKPLVDKNCLLVMGYNTPGWVKSFLLADKAMVDVVVDQNNTFRSVNSDHQDSVQAADNMATNTHTVQSLFSGGSPLVAGLKPAPKRNAVLGELGRHFAEHETSLMVIRKVSPSMKISEY